MIESHSTGTFKVQFNSVSLRQGAFPTVFDHRRTQYFITEGVHVVGAARKSGDGSPQKLKKNVKLVYHF